MKFNFITIEGNIGAGKTSLSKKIANDFNGRLILEQFADNPFLPEFYKDKERHAFPLELFFMAERFQQISKYFSEGDLFSDFTVSDYCFYKSIIFAGNNLGEEEEKLFQRLFFIINRSLPKPEQLLYLYSPTEKLLENIQKRGRDYEKHIKADYLDAIHERYMEFFKKGVYPSVILLDTSEMDFVNNDEDYQKIVGLFDEPAQPGIRYIAKGEL